ncbi:MAG: outer membrane protein transport protein [Flavobacteriaceae bacterium]|nr:outer membrane protein transport protein [Flavobacteriaceae bacterium]
MKNNYLKLIFLLFSSAAFSQAGHIMQGVGAVNMSMGGAATAQPLDISGALQWNPAAITVFDENTLKLDVGLFFSSPKLSSYLPAGMLGPGMPAVYGTTEDNRGVSPLPNLAYVWKSANGKSTFGASAFGISGFGVDFPQETNLPFTATGDMNPNFNPYDSNPISWPQNLMGFGHVKSDYMLLQVGFAWATQLSDKVSFGIQPNIDYASLQLEPNPLSSPSPTLGYPKSDKASAIGFGGQVGIYYQGEILKLGASYKTQQYFSKFKFKNTYLDGSGADDVEFTMNYPAIFSVGMGLSSGQFDFALDFRRVLYDQTKGFEAKGWTQTASVKGFGWENISVLSTGLQYKGIKKLPLRVGYTFSSNPINSDLAFFSIPATAIIKDAVQFGFSYLATDRLSVDAVYHHGMSSGTTEGTLLNPQMVNSSNPYGAMPGTKVSYDMTTDMIMLGISYKFNK